MYIYKVGGIKVIKSMTGYGKGQNVTEEREVTVEVRSVNNRYFDVNIKSPRYLMFAEDKIKKLLSEFITRGKIDVYISVNSKEDSGKKVVLDRQLAESYTTAFKELCSQLDITYDLCATRFLNSDIVKIEHEEQTEEEIWQYLEPVLRESFSNHTKMRQQEGNRLKTDILGKLSTISETVSEIEKLVPLNIESYKQKLFSKITDALQSTDIDENRIIQEVAIYTDKVCVDEETVRLKSHLKAATELLESAEPVGKKFDFLVQEMNREINTIGSKSNELKISSFVVNVKNEIEKIREQIQNIE